MSMAATKDRKLVIVGDSAFAEVACEYFTCDSRYEVCAFAVEEAHLKRDRLLDLPVVAFEKLADQFPPATHEVYVAPEPERARHTSAAPARLRRRQEKAPDFSTTCQPPG
jgi:hypothetical protein